MVTMDHVPRHTAALPASSHHSAGFKFKILPNAAHPTGRPLAAAFASCQHGFRECVTSSALQAVSLCPVLFSNLALFSPPQVVDFVKPLISRAMFFAGFSYYEAGGRFPSYYAYGFGSTASTATQNAQQAYLFFQVLTLVLSIACATLCNVLLAYTYARPSDSYADKFSESVKISVRIVFRLLLFAHITYCSALVLIGFVFFPDSKFALYACVTVFTALLLYTILVVVGTAKTFVDIEAMTVEDVAAQLQQTSAAVALQSNFESSAEFRIGALNSLGGSAALLLAFAVTAIQRYIPQSSCVLNNGYLGAVASPFSPTPVLPPSFVTLWRSHCYPIDSCAHKQLKRQTVRGIRVNFLFQYSILFRLEFLATCVQAGPSGTIYIVAAVAAAFCGYLTSIHGLLISTLVSNFEPAPKFACKKRCSCIAWRRYGFKNVMLAEG